MQCGEFLPDPNEMYSMFPKTMDLEELFRLEGECVAGESDSVELVSPKGKVYSCDFDGRTLDRRVFDKYLAKLAVEAGARLETKTSLLSMSGGSARTTMGDIKARVIVGADGPNSRTARQAGLKNPDARYPAVTCQTAHRFEPTVRMYFGSVAPGGYAWVIPKRNGANVGVGFNPELLSERPRTVFDRFVAKLGIKVDEVTMGFVPLSGPLDRTVAGNTILVGDAAGHVMPTNGGGIPLAMIAGRIAGRTVREHLKSGVPLMEYEHRWKAALGKPLANSLWTKRFGNLFFPSDRRTEFAMAVLGKRGLARAIRCRRVFYLI